MSASLREVLSLCILARCVQNARGNPAVSTAGRVGILGLPA